MSSKKLELNIEVDVSALKEGFATGLKLAQKFVKQFNGLISGERTQIDIKDFDKTIKAYQKRIKTLKSEIVNIPVTVDTTKAETILEKFRNKQEKKGLFGNIGSTVANVGFAIQGVAQIYSTLENSIGRVIALSAAQEKAERKVEQAVKQTGQAAGWTADELKSMASGLQEMTTYGDEDILNNVTAQLLTFTNISGEQFSKTQMAALDLATVLDGDLKSASIQLGKALNDPVANLSALSRSGIQFSEEQKELIKTLWEAGEQAQAQNVILEELSHQYGGQATAQAETFAGKMEQLGNVVGDLGEDLGDLLSVFLLPLVSGLQKLASGVVSFMGNFQSLKTNADKVKESFLQQRGEFEANVSTLKELRDKQNKSKAELKQYKQIVDEMQSKYGSYLSNINLEKDGWDKVSASLDKVRNSLIDKRKQELRMAEFQDLIDEQYKAEEEEAVLLEKKRRVEAEINAKIIEQGLNKENLNQAEERLKNSIYLRSKEYGKINQKLKENEKLQADIADKMEEQGIKLDENSKKGGSGTTKTTSKGVDETAEARTSASELLKIRQEYNLAMLESDYQRQIKSLEYEKQANLDKVADMKVSEDEKWNASLMITKTYDKKIEAEKKKHTENLLNAEKKANVESKGLVLDTARAMIEAFSNAGEKSAEEIDKQAQAMVDAMSYIGGQINSIVSMMSQNLADEKAKETEAVELRADKEGKSEEWLATEKEKINAKYAKKEKQLAKAKKAMAITDATINTAVAVSKALGMGGVLGPIMAGIIAGLGAVQIALIAKQKYASGGYTGKAESGVSADETGEKPVGIVHEGEYVFERGLVDRYGSFLASLRGKMQSGEFKGFATGGFAGAPIPVPVVAPAALSVSGNNADMTKVLEKLVAIETAVRELELGGIEITNSSNLVEVHKANLKARKAYDRRTI